MTSHGLFEFNVDRETHLLTIRGEFPVKAERVWKAFTKSELLEQWFAPRPLSTRTKSMDFREGGSWIYAMIDPDGTEYWGRTDYVTIDPGKCYSAFDGFCDSEGNILEDMPRARWDVTFSNAGQHTILQIVVTYHSLEDLEKVLQMGMEEGMAATFERLNALLEEW